jgi:hypothetical protein
MSAARGDRKPCSRTGCPGTMQFGRQPLPKTPTMMTADGERGWVCSKKVEHFELASERLASELVARSSAHASWDDDGGSEKAERL